MDFVSDDGITSGDGVTVDTGGDAFGGSTITVGAGTGAGAGAGTGAGFSCSTFTGAFFGCTLAFFASFVGGRGFFFGLLLENNCEMSKILLNLFKLSALCVR